MFSKLDFILEHHKEENWLIIWSYFQCVHTSKHPNVIFVNLKTDSIDYLFYCYIDLDPLKIP